MDCRASSANFRAFTNVLIRQARDGRYDVDDNVQAKPGAHSFGEFQPALELVRTAETPHPPL